MDKYSRLRQRVAADERLQGMRLVEPVAASITDLERVHHPEYIQAVLHGGLDRRQQSRIGFPWSVEMAERSRRSVGGTMGAMEAALADGVSVNLAGGTHHAHHAEGRGYCVFNDSVVAIHWARQALGIQRFLVADLDVHQGDGTAALTSNDCDIFTLSLHGARNYPSHKPASDLDVALPDGCDDEDYLAALDQALARVAESFQPQLVVYLAGADPFTGDRLGRLALSKQGLASRDRTVLNWCRQASLPVAVTMAGGYAENIEDIVDIHHHTVLCAFHHSRQAPQLPHSA